MTELPAGLEVCPYCGTVRDAHPSPKVADRMSVCLCDGIVCKRCRAGRVRRPVSDYYDRGQRAFIHVPHFHDRASCKACMELEKRLGEEEAQRRRAVLRECATALTSCEHSVDDALPEHTLLAVVGDVAAWRELGLGDPPDQRPLYVGRGLPAGRTLPRTGVRVGTWLAADGPVDGDELLRELLVRWRPPLNDEIDTPWNREPGDG